MRTASEMRRLFFPWLFVGSFTVLFACGGSTRDDGSPGPNADGPDAAPKADRPQRIVPKTWCDNQPKHTFCADFDRGGIYDAFETVRIEKSNGDALLGASDRSPPSALVLTGKASGTDESFSGGAYVAQIIKVDTPKRIRLGVDVRIDAVGIREDGGRQQVAFLGLAGRADLFLDMALNLRKTKTELQGGAQEGPAPGPVEDPPRGRWFRLELVVTSDGGGAMELRYDGRLIAARASPAGIPRASLVVVGLGSVSYGPMDASGMTYDNVTLDVE